MGQLVATSRYLRLWYVPCDVVRRSFLAGDLLTGILEAFTTKHDVHWIVALLGTPRAPGGLFISLPSSCLYVPCCYPRYAASLLAANALARSIFAVAAILYAPPMFKAMGVAGGVAMLAALTVVCCAGIWVLYIFGARLRARSRFAVK